MFLALQVILLDNHEAINNVRNINRRFNVNEKFAGNLPFGSIFCRIQSFF